MSARRYPGRLYTVGGLLLAGLLALTGCAPESGGAGAAADDRHAATDATGHADDAPGANAASPAAEGQPAIRQPGGLATVTGVPVFDRVGPGEAEFEVVRRTPDVPGSTTRRIGTETFDLALRLRRPDLTQYPCTSCHLGREMALDVDRIADAHQDIRPVHPAETGATCATCHARTDVELLTLFDGATVEIDHAYRLCAQCHFRQLEDWESGGHGKRLDGWQGRRVVMGCADCHDPHNPAVEARLPYPGPRILRPGLR